MQVEKTIDPAARVVTLSVSGDLDDADLMRLASELEQAHGVEPDFSLLIDMREARGRGVTGDGVRALAARPLVLAPSARRAVVVPTDLGFGMARMYEMRAEPRGGPVRVFRDLAEAQQWLRSGE